MTNRAVNGVPGQVDDNATYRSQLRQKLVPINPRVGVLHQLDMARLQRLTTKIAVPEGRERLKPGLADNTAPRQG